MDFTRAELESADLLLVVDSDGAFKWVSKRSNIEVSNILHDIGLKVRGIGEGETRAANRAREGAEGEGVL